jgi:hypothetical protein
MAIKFHFAAAAPTKDVAKSKFAAAADAAITTLPDLSAFPDPLDKVCVLLEAAAEIEHMLLIQYLYAALTLKAGDALNALPQPQRSAVAAWRNSLMTVAIEEMGHLMSVQNLLLLVGAEPIFDREEFPPKVAVYPFPPQLERLTKTSLAKYVLAEAPFGSEHELGQYTALVDKPVNHVGVVYGLLGVLFGEPGELAREGDGNDPWGEFVRLLAQKCGALEQPDRWHLPAAALHPDRASLQGDPDDFPTAESGFFCRRVTSKPEARALLRDIGLQGEAPVEAPNGPVSHYSRFRTIFEGTETVPAFPAGNAEPTYHVATDPKLADYAGEALTIATDIDATYAAMITSLKDYLSPALTESRADAAASALEAMAAIRRSTRELLALPQKPGSPFVASPVFTAPK